MDEQPDAEDGEDHQAQGQLQHHSPVAQQVMLGNSPAIEKEQRRQEQQEEDVGIQRHRRDHR